MFTEGLDYGFNYVIANTIACEDLSKRKSPFSGVDNYWHPPVIGFPPWGITENRLFEKDHPVRMA